MLKAGLLLVTTKCHYFMQHHSQGGLCAASAGQIFNFKTKARVAKSGHQEADTAHISP